MELKPLVSTLKADNKSQLNPKRPLLTGYSRIVLIAVWYSAMPTLSLGRETAS